MRQPPQDYQVTKPDTGLSNFDRKIDPCLEEKLRAGAFITYYAGWNFRGKVWWDRELSKFCCQIWQYHAPVETVEADSLFGIMRLVSDKYGWN